MGPELDCTDNKMPIGDEASWHCKERGFLNKQRKKSELSHAESFCERVNVIVL